MTVANLRETSKDRVVSPEFLRKLQARDPDLDLTWHPNCNRWVLKRFVNQEVLRNGLYVNERVPVHVLTLRWPDGAFRDYGDWLFEWLNDSDTFNIDMEGLFRHQDELAERKRENSIRNSGQNVEDWARDHRVSFNNWWGRRQRGMTTP